uniref:Uncharacterized protein n=1 Tax=Arundo donax TaxID=35708 RepID=A0A0A9H6J2_ARUDO
MPPRTRGNRRSPRRRSTWWFSCSCLFFLGRETHWARRHSARRRSRRRCSGRCRRGWRSPARRRIGTRTWARTAPA